MYVKNISLLLFLFTLGFLCLVSLLNFIFHHRFPHGKQLILESVVSLVEKRIACE